MLARLRGFVARYGWRAYALPVLVAVTVLALVSAAHSGRQPGPDQPRVGAAAHPTTRSAPPTAAGTAQLKRDAGGPGAVDTAIKGGALPAGGVYTKSGAGTFRVVPGSTPVIGRGPLSRYTIEVENGITGINVAAFAKQVDTVLADRRSWSAHGVSLQRIDSGQPDFRITLTSVMTVRTLCGYTIPVETSCHSADGRVVLNVARWVRGAAAYIADLKEYRIYMINHEVGHALGHQHAHQCLPGGLAPVMMQQTFGLKSTTGQMCQANPWPYPPGVQGAPGKEEPDTPQNSEYGLGGD